MALLGLRLQRELEPGPAVRGFERQKSARSVASLMGLSRPSITLNIYNHAREGMQETVVEAVSDVLATAQARLTAGKNAA